MHLRVFGASALVFMASAAQATFNDQEQAEVMAYWSAPGRYTVTAPVDADKVGPWQVRLTAEGSLWLWNYNRIRGIGKVAPTQDPAPQNEAQRVWERWLEKKVEYDRWQAAVAAKNANEKALGRKIGTVPPPAPDPGPAPADLIAFATDPPPFAAAVAPLRHIIKFDDGVEVSYNDQVPMRPRYAYFRFPQGVMYAGKSVRSIPEPDLLSLFAEAGIDGSAAKVMRSVSLLEGGFDSVNTYDTGFVSVGLLQFACLSGGSGSLGSVLLDMKRVTPDDFHREFKRKGIDVEESGVLLVLDPSTGALVRGPEAAKKIIDDKRMIAVFQKAGMNKPFQLAQLRVALSQYYPASDDISIMGNDGPMFGKVSDFIKSEAGMATLMDRKVNTGRTDPLIAVTTRVAAERNVRSLAELVPFERDIVTALKYRKDYLADPTLTQPPATVPLPPGARSSNSSSRGAAKARSTPRNKRR